MAHPQGPFRPASAEVSLPELEHDILTHWDQSKIFEQTLAKTAGNAHFSFYDGPPFATGLPHYGHLLAGVLKDVVPRYWTMRGYHVPRRFGWDCHGLPVEYEINQKLGLRSSKQIRELGIANYNSECRSIVQRYTEEWKSTVRRIGRWVDMENAYRTMDCSFMQSVWWVFKQLWEQGLVYEDLRVQPYSVGVSTVLSNFEANLNYKDVQDPAITVAFKARELPNLYLLAWTTTPWTLPSNLALAVHPEIEYVFVEDAKSGHTYVLAKALAAKYFEDVERSIVRSAHGADLIGMSYEPLFPFFATRDAFRVIPSAHVTVESGTGIVHMAPAYGEEDFQACRAAGLPIVDPVDDDGRFTAQVPDWAGRPVKEADPEIIARLKQQGDLFRHETITHSYPFCWRSDTPLIYKAVATWFVKVESIRDRIVAANQATSWVPAHLRDGRFGNWLENARDWAVSRNRFWGTPLPIWRNVEGEQICIGSVEELERLAQRSISDIHLDVVAGISIPSPTGKSPLVHVGGVFDCWFESGSMPCAQIGYPFEGEAQFKAGFPADFIAEGLDQTRGWFYTLMVIGAALFGKSPFKNVIVNGLILAEDGRKMSKRLRNYPDPSELLEKHGADALRLYMIDSPVVKAEPLKFSETGVREIVRKVLLRWWNAYSFFVSYANIDGFVPCGDAHESPNILDQWLLSRVHTLIEFTNAGMARYEIFRVVPALTQFIEELTNTYIRFNREHFWRDGMPDDKRFAFETLHYTLVTLAKAMAPFTPFLSEAIYLNLTAGGQLESVHLESYPEANAALRKPELEDAVSRMSQLVLMGRNLRERLGIRAKVPLQRMWVIHRDQKVLDSLVPLQSYLAEELGVLEVIYDTDETANLKVSAVARFPRLGPRLGKKMKAVAAAVARLGPDEIDVVERGGKMILEGEEISIDDIEIRREPKGDSSTLMAHSLISLRLDPTVTPQQLEEGTRREVVRLIQSARKDARLPYDARIEIQIAAPEPITAVVERHRESIARATLATSIEVSASLADERVKEGVVDGHPAKVMVRIVS